MISTQNKSPLPPETTKSKLDDEIFGEIIVKMVSGITECGEKYLLKLRIQQDITNTSFSVDRANNTQERIPLTSTNPSISMTNGGSQFLRRHMAASPQVFEHLQ